MRVRPATLEQIHGALADLAAGGGRAAGSLRTYALGHGIHHLLEAGRAPEAGELVGDLGYGVLRLSELGARASHGLTRDSDDTATRLRGGCATGEWSAFYASVAHFLARGGPRWPAERILVQLAGEEPADGAVAAFRARWLTKGCGWTRLEREVGGASSPWLSAVLGATRRRP